MVARLTLIAGILLLALASTASAHEIVGDHIDTRSELATIDLAKVVAATNAEGDEAGLPASWCGTRRTSDYVADPAFDTALPQFKVVYAYPSDEPDRFDQWKDGLQADVSLIGRFMGAQSGGRKAPRFDMGTECGHEYVDVQVVELPGPRSAYVNNFDAIRTAVRAQLTHAVGERRNVVVLGDALSGSPVGYWSGLGTKYTSESPLPSNPSNTGNIFSVLFVPKGDPAPGADPDGWWPEGMLHEMTHNLGGVGGGSPHATTAGHCYDGYDVMCYDDGGLGSHSMTFACARIAGVMGQVFDCGRDDYFNVAPGAGSYLATHWNVYDNVYLAGCASVAPACGATTVVPLVPAVITAPQVYGAAKVGSSLTATRGTWSNSPITYAYQWERGDGGSWSAVPGATGTSYTVGAADAGQRLRVRVVATNGDGGATAYSPSGAVVTADSPPPTPTPGAPVTGPAGGTTVPKGSVTGSTLAPGGAPAARRPAGRARLTVAVGRRKGRRLGTIAFSVASGKVTASRARIRLAKGRYELMLCTTAGASPTTPRCARRRVTVKGGATRLPRLTTTMAAGVEGRVSYTVTAVGRRLFAARTAKRPALGVLLRG